MLESLNKYRFLFLILYFLFGCSASPQNKITLKKERIFDLPNVAGRIDHLSVDRESGRLFIAALGNGSVEIVDLRSGRVVHSITGLEEPQGILYYAKNNLLFVTSGGNGTCSIYDAADFRLLKIIQLGGDADNIRYDKKRDIVFVGFGSGGIAAIKPAGMKLLYQIDLPAHPESFQIDESKGLMFVNVPEAGELDEIHIDMKKVTNKIKLGVSGNFPMALDTLNNMIFIGSRKPSRLISYNEVSMKKISESDLSGDADDIFYDSFDSLLFVSCGSGYIDIFKQRNSNEIIFKESIETYPGARTSLYVPLLNAFFVAARKYDGHDAKVIEYSIQK